MSDAGGEGARRRGRPVFARAVTVMVLWNLAWWAVVGMAIAPRIPGGWAVVGAMAVAALAPLWPFHRAFTGRLYPGAAMRLLVFRPFWYIQLLLPLLGIAAIVGALVGWARGMPRAAALAAVAGTAVVFWAGMLAGWIGSRLLVTRRVTASHPDLPPAFDGLRIVQLSDLHVGPHTSRRFLAKVAAATGAEAPDVVVFTGDQVDDYARDTEPFARAFGRVRAPLGVFAIAGNHDVYAGWSGVRRGLEAAGQRVLVNEAVAIERDGTSLWLAGTGDPAGRGFTRGGGAEAAPDIARTLAGVPAGGFVVALAHNPALWPALVERGVPLTLSGHTHHGQLSVPHLDWSLASVFLEHAMGAYERDGCLLYVSPGTNYWGLPFRLGALPEVTVITLRRGPAGVRATTPAA